MKNIFLSILFVSLFSMVISQNKNVDLRKSEITWTGSKVTGTHYGNVSLKDAKLEFDNGKLKSGFFTIDMTSLTVTDIKGASADKLLAHLKSDDFFSVSTYNEATLELIQVAHVKDFDYVIVGNLTIKGITKMVKFEAVIKDNSASATVVVDRTEYGIKYGSGSFFDNLGDKAINNNFNLQVNLVY
jgi:polyisoprenoid-binding protein YceI